MKKSVLFLLLMSVFVFAIPKDTLIVGVENEANRLNPLFSEDHDEAIGAIFSGLVTFDEKMNIAPSLAQSWKVSSSGLVYEFVLKEGVFWHDGKPFSAEDVAFTLEALRDTKLNSPLRVNFEMIDSIKVLGKNKIKITLSKPFPAFLDALSVGILPKHLLQNQDLNHSEFNQKPIGTGPYQFVKWKKGQYIELKANPKFYLGKVETPHLIFKIIANPSVRSVELKNGSIDIALVDFELASSFQNNQRFNLLMLESADYRALMFNLKNPIFQDKAVRVALNYAVNKEAMLQNLLHSYGFVANNPIELSWANCAECPTFNYDPLKAEEILKQAGWQKNPQGILQKDGKPLSFEIYAMNDDPLRVAIASVLQSEFAKLGVESKVIAKPSGSFDYTQVDTFLVGWGSPYDPDFHTYRIFSSSQDSDTNESGWNFGHYANPRVDQSLLLARSVSNQDKRKEHYANFISALQQDPPYIFLLYLKFPLVYVSNLKGVKPHIVGHHGVGFTWNVWQWSKQ